MKSVMQHNFARIENSSPPRSSFDRSFGYKTTFNAGDLIPHYVEEILPGDSVNLNPKLFARLATPLKPFMDNLFLEQFFFFVPCRLLWDNWERMNGQQDDPDSSTDYLVPQCVFNNANYPDGLATGSLFDYFGLPTNVPIGVGKELSVNALPLRAYNLIYNQWFRDQNLQDSLTVARGDGPDSPGSLYGINKRCKKHDYFTSCLPWPQKGPGVEIPLGNTAPVYGTGKTLGLTDGNQRVGFMAASGNELYAGTDFYNVNVGTAGVSDVSLNGVGFGVVQKGTGNFSGMYADLSDATAATINDLRAAFQLQRLMERDARGGTRYTELLRSHFGVYSPDARLQRAEFLGSSSERININPVQQTSGTPTAGTPQGNLAGYGVCFSGRGGFSKSFTEHGYIIGLVNVRADITYQNGLHKMWTRQERLDFALPVLSHLGEQVVLNSELVYACDPAKDDGIFGYQERYADYRYRPSTITGQYRSNATGGSLDYWHLGLDFGSEAPVLGNTFIKDAPPISRVIAVPDEPEFLLDCYFQQRHARVLPTYGTPGLLDHL